MPLADADASREHIRVLRTNGAVLIQDLGAKNGTWLGGARLSNDQRVAWRSTQMLKVGGTVLALVEPVADALAELEAADDEPIDPQDTSSAPDQAAAKGPLPSRVGLGTLGTEAAASLPETGGKTRVRRRGMWSVLDLLVMGAALGVLALSLAGIYWLLRGASVVPGR
jgi:hypothetical protein